MSVTDTVTTRIPSELPAPLYAFVGAADRAVHEARHLPTRVEGLVKDTETSTTAVRDDLVKRFETIRDEITAFAQDAQENVTELPEDVRENVTEFVLRPGRPRRDAARRTSAPATWQLVDEAKKAYAEYTKRGEKLVTEIRTSEATVEAEKQVKTAASKTKAAQTTAKKAAASTTKARKSAATSTRKAAEAVAEAVEEAADTVGK